VILQLKNRSLPAFKGLLSAFPHLRDEESYFYEAHAQSEENEEGNNFYGPVMDGMDVMMH